VPEIFDYDEELGLLLVEDLGDFRLYDIQKSDIKNTTIERLLKI